MNEKLIRKLVALEANAPSKTGNWVRGLSGQLIWDEWDFPEPTAEEAAATLARLMATMDATAERLKSQPGWTEPTEAEKAEAISGLEEARERYEEEKRQVRAFTAQVERERAERAAVV
jgi:hypothetical protein